MRFTKMQGVGNDFVVLDAADLPGDADLPALAVRFCHRKFGIGADGLLVVSRVSAPSPSSLVPRSPTLPRFAGEGEENLSEAPLLRSGGGVGERGTSEDGEGAEQPTPLTMQMFNPDGTEDVCGNGLRCVGMWAFRRGWTDGKREFVVNVLDGPRAVRLTGIANNGRTAILTVDMGCPKFAPEDIPMCGSETVLRIENRAFPIMSVNTGSTHTVIFGDELPDQATFQHYSPLIEHHPLFPERTSVLWATPRGDETFDVRIWERGVGETLGCGTGACAVAVAARRLGLASDAPVKILSKGGALSIVWPGGDAPILMSGPAAFVFDGDFPL